MVNRMASFSIPPPPAPMLVAGPNGVLPAVPRVTTRASGQDGTSEISPRARRAVGGKNAEAASLPGGGVGVSPSAVEPCSSNAGVGEVMMFSASVSESIASDTVGDTARVDAMLKDRCPDESTRTAVHSEMVVGNASKLCSSSAPRHAVATHTSTPSSHTTSTAPTSADTPSSLAGVVHSADGRGGDATDGQTPSPHGTGQRRRRRRQLPPPPPGAQATSKWVMIEFPNRNTNYLNARIFVCGINWRLECFYSARCCWYSCVNSSVCCGVGATAHMHKLLAYVRVLSVFWNALF